MGEVADSRRHRQVSGHADRRGAELRRPAFGDRQRLFCGRLREKQRELVAADPAEDVAGARARLEEARGLHQRRISCLVTVGVVDALEVVEVEEHERKRPSVALGTSDLALDPLLERAMVQEPGQRIAGGLGQEARARVGVRDREPDEIGEDAEPLLQIGRDPLLGTRDDEQGAPQLPAHADRDGDAARRPRPSAGSDAPGSCARRLGTVRACRASRAGHDRHARRAVQRDQAPGLPAAHAPGADDLGDAVHAKANDGAGVDAGDSRGLLRHELVDHLRRAHLGHGDRQLAQRRLLLEQITNACLGRRATVGPGYSRGRAYG